MTPETRHFLNTLRARRRIRWTPLAVAEALSIPAMLSIVFALGWCVMSWILG